jgi:hypothetical protein
MSSSGQQFLLNQSVYGGQWHVSGTVAATMGFALFWVLPAPADGGPQSLLPVEGPLDLSGYAGIQLDIGGDAGPLGLVTMYAQSSNQRSPSPSICGTCTGDAGVCDIWASAPLVAIAPTMKTYQIRWTDLTSPGAPFDPAHVEALSWEFPWTPGEQPYTVAVQIDNIELIPKQ